MKAYRKPHSYRRTPSSPSKAAWACLLLAWLIVLPIALLVGKAAVAEAKNRTEPEPEASAKPEPENTMQVQATCTRFAPMQSLRSDKPTILIYHTHTTEAYFQTPEEQYKESSKWRTNDPENNVIAVGERLKEILESEYGFCVLHDTTNHEPPKLADAYDRSLLTVQKAHETYPSIVLFIDLHRDAYETETGPKDFVTINGTESARLMFVIGKGVKYADKPFFETNYALAERITEHLKTIDANLVRPVRVKTGRYNQHIAPNSILVEVGHNANTLTQAKNAMPYLAEGIAYAFRAGQIAPGDWIPN